jgi:predicted nucleic acid-binding protein
MTGDTHANDYVSDTVGLILRIEQRKMGSAAKTIFERAEAGNCTIYIPGIAFAEILYLSERNKIDISFQESLDYLTTYPSFKEYPTGLAVVQTAGDIIDIPELHDRLIAATAQLLNCELITNDRVIGESKFVRTIW